MKVHVGFHHAQEIAAREMMLPVDHLSKFASSFGMFAALAQAMRMAIFSRNSRIS